VAATISGSSDFYVIFGIIGFSYGIVLLSEKPITPCNEPKRG
jgi:hypothetical protein